jgi:hypothetical protein
MEKSVKRDAIASIFNELRGENPNSTVFIFDNDKVKEITSNKFSNQFDATKFDTTKLLPSDLRNNVFFIMHLGTGKHAFVKGIGYHAFEPIQSKKNWKSSKSFIDTLGKSEASTVSELYNSKIIHDFLFGRTDVSIKVHTARRTKISYEVLVGETLLHAESQQIEIDGIFETDNTIVAVEAKNAEHDDFEIRQLFNIMKYFEKKKLPSNYKLRIIFVVRVKEVNKNFFRLYEYGFTDNKKLNSIRLLRNIEYDINPIKTLDLKKWELKC